MYKNILHYERPLCQVFRLVNYTKKLEKGGFFMLIKSEIIRKTLIQNGVEENDVVIIQTDIIFKALLHLQDILILLLSYFFVIEEIEEEKQIDFIMQNFTEIVDIVTIELEIVLHNFIYMNNEPIIEEVELNQKDEILLTLIIKDNVSEKLKKIIKK